jgi:hypothetical protein
MRRQRLRGVAAALVAVGVVLLVTGGDPSTARIFLVGGLLYAVLVVIGDWRERRR